MVRLALDRGVTFFDTADVYGQGLAETAWGRAFAGVRRDHYVLASKAFFPMSDHPFDRGLSRKHLRSSLNASLGRLKTDYLDLYQCHRFDPAVPIAEIVRTMDDFVTAGKILHWGVSCWSGAQIAEACAIAAANGREAPVTNQPPYNLLDRGIEAEVIPASRAAGVAQIVFSPLAQGVLSGKYRGGKKPAGSRATDPRSSHFMDRYLAPEAAATVDRLARVADDAGLPLARLALAWCLRDPAVASVIVGATNERQLEENLAAAETTLGPDVLAAVSAALQSKA